MSRASASCPNCGAPVAFTWSGSVQTVCTRCQSILVRRDHAGPPEGGPHAGLLERVGQISDPPPDTSPIQLGTRGRVDGRAFDVIGRIAYEYDGGAWSEWHLLFDGGRTGWLSDAQLRYAVYEQPAPQPDLPARERVAPGTSLTWSGQRFEVTTVTSARYRGAEGELPFTTWDRELSTFADLRGTGTAVATIDYSGDAPVFFAGRSVSFDDLSLRNLREVDRTRTVAVGALKCQNCAAPLVIKAVGQSQSIVCGHCGSIADATDPNVAILQRAAKQRTITPMIPLGSSGDWHGARYEVIGFQRREITVDGTDYGWHEYVLFNPQHGFRYLSEYDGHWNDIAVLDEIPESSGLGPHAPHTLRGRSFRHFQSAEARTVFVLGEFPWIVKVGEKVQVHDYVSPPYLLSAEGTRTDSTWSLGTYVQAEALWQAFSVEGHPLPAVGVFANQPSPISHGWTYWRMFAGLAALLILVAFARLIFSGSTTAFSGSFRFDPASPNPAFVTEPFELGGRTSNVDVSLGSNLSNNWMVLNLALINEETGVALDFGRQLEYYFGVEAGESWSEGSRFGRVVLPSVPAGRYYFRVEPEGDAASRAQVDYSLTARRDRPAWGLYGIALVLLFIPPLAVTLRHAAFEGQRWSQSDYGGGDDEDEDD